MSKFKAFLKANVRQPEPVDVQLARFDEPIKVRPLTSAEADAINSRCFKNKPGRKGRQEQVFDTVKYNREICVASIVYPDLHDSELQADYGVRGAENLFGAMFWLGESTQILEIVAEISGLDVSLEDEVEEAKN